MLKNIFLKTKFHFSQSPRHFEDNRLARHADDSPSAFLSCLYAHRPNELRNDRWIFIVLGSFVGSFLRIMGILALRGIRIDVNLPVFVISSGGDLHPLDPWFVCMSNAVYLFFSQSVIYRRMARLFSLSLLC